MNKKTLVYALALLVVAGTMGVVSVLAQENTEPTDKPFFRCGFGGEHRGQILEDKAEILGISVEDLQSAREEGKTFEEVLTEAGISQEDFQAKMKELHQENMKTHLDQLVADGELTQAEADEHLENWQERMDNFDGQRHFGKHGFHPGWGMPGEINPE